jgi:hypothetical protein
MSRFIDVGTERWREIWAVAQTLRSGGKLTYVNLKLGAKCSGDVAHRVMLALAAEHAANGEVEACAPLTNTEVASDTFPEPMETQWVEQVARLKREVLSSMRGQVTLAVTAHDADVTRFRGVENDLRVNLSAALADVATYSASADQVDALEAQIAALEQQAANALTASSKTEADLTRQLHDAQSVAKVAGTALTEAVTARVRAETSVEHFRGRAETAEGEVTRLRAELFESTVRAARLEGQLDGVGRSHNASVTPVPLDQTIPTAPAAVTAPDTAAE